MNITNTLTTVETIEVSRKEGKRRVPVGKVTVYIPTPADLGIDTSRYPQEVRDWLARCLRANALADARNKLAPQSAELKAGAKIATTIIELATPAENTGASLAEISELKKGFAAYLATLSLSAKAQATLNALVASPKALAVQPAAVRERCLERLAAYLDSIGNELTPAQAAYLEKLSSATEEEELDIDDL